MTITLPKRPTRPSLKEPATKPDGTWTDAWLRYWAALDVYMANLEDALKGATP